MSMIGKTLGSFECTELLGKGGMGEVYKAKDQKLGRDVAIKVLPEEFAKDTDRVARFQREAKLLASLNHPNIASIFGLEESDGTHFLVLELIEGDTLADRLKRGPIAAEESLKLALQIAEALEAAHEKGVIHRDLKPANIKVTPYGKVKVLDFGLAKAFAGEQGDMNLSDSPTLSDAATQQGVILGTAAYMPPEQAKGKVVDKRADIWAFGVVLFEMLTGRQVFTGETVSDTLASVLAREPSWKNLPPNLHTRIVFLLERCLEKDPKNRYGDISDARVDIQKVLADPGGVFAQAATSIEPKAKSQQVLLWASITLVLIIIVGVIVWNLRPTTESEPRDIIRFSYELPEDYQLSALNLAISPDGKKFVYGTSKGFYLRSTDEMETQLIYETDENPESLSFSPDGQWVCYFSQKEKRLKKIAISGGAPFVICDASAVEGARWYVDNTIVFSQIPGGIMRVSANGGTPAPLLKADYTKIEEVGFPIYPQLLPDGKTLLYTLFFSWVPLKAKIMLHSLESGKSEELFDGFIAFYVSTGHIGYAFGNLGDMDIYAVPFDLDSLKMTGSPVTMFEGISNGALSESGTVAYISRAVITTEPQFILVWVDREGNEEPLETQPDRYDSPKVSPDGKQIALLTGSPYDIWIWDVERKIRRKLTLHETGELQPTWTPDSRSIIYWSNHEEAGTGGIYRRAADGTGTVEKLFSATDRTSLPWSMPKDGKFLFMQELVSTTNADVGMLSMEEDYKRTVLLQEDYSEAQPMVSPNGRFVAYVSNESTGEVEQSELYLCPYPEVDEWKEQVSNGGGICPLWSPDSQELYYLTPENDVMVVSVKTEPELDLGPPKHLFHNNNQGFVFGRGYPWDIHPDGDRFLMLKEPKSTEIEPLKINIIMNWFEDLKLKAPVD